MTVCMMNDNFFRSSGSAIAIRRIAEMLTQADYCVAGTGDRQPEDLTWIPAGRYEKFDLKTLSPFRLSTELVRFRSWLKQQDCGLVHCHHRRLAVLLQLAGIPVLYTGQNAFPSSGWFRWLHPRFMTAITPSVAANILENTRTPVLAVISNPSLFPPVPPTVPLDVVRNRAVCIARLDPIKGHNHLLSAWKLLLEQGCEAELYLVGEGHLRHELEQQARHAGLGRLVHFCGYSDDVNGFIDKALFAILVSESEGQGVVTLEAAAAGRPSLLTAVPGSVDLLPPGRQLTNGLPFGDVPKLAEALHQWFAHPEKVALEGRIFFDFLKGTCDGRVIAAQYEAVYSEVLDLYKRGRLKSFVQRRQSFQPRV